MKFKTCATLASLDNISRTNNLETRKTNIRDTREE